VDGALPPFELLLSRVCEEFHCAPDVALRQPAKLTLRVMDVRSYTRAKARVEDPNTKDADLKASERRMVADVLSELKRRGQLGRK
jgi:hypothetical protein